MECAWLSTLPCTTRWNIASIFTCILLLIGTAEQSFKYIYFRANKKPYIEKERRSTYIQKTAHENRIVWQS